MTEVVDRLLTDRRERHALGVAAAEHAEHFTWERTVQSWESLLARRAAGGAVTAATDATHPVTG
jgi:hypothetical protein